MEPTSELLQLLREIRDAQRESLAVTKAWIERSDERYREWQAQQTEFKAERDAFKKRNEPDAALWREANARIIQQSEDRRRQQRLGKRIGLAVLGIMLLGAITLGILATMGLLK